MGDQILVKPLSQKTRQKTFSLLILVFITVIPLLYLYASGYRLDLKQPTNFVSTGGISVTVNEPGAEIFIDDEPVRTARAFSKAFYAQGIDVGTHRVFVRKEGYHTWVKELPVSKRLVTEAVSFNLPLVPQVSVISKWESATGSAIVSSQILGASTTNPILATTTKNTKGFIANERFTFLQHSFSTTSTTTEKETRVERIKELLDKDQEATSTVETQATTTIIKGGVRLSEKGDDLYATWVGPFEEMPYYYCSPDFPRYSTSTATATKNISGIDTANVLGATDVEDEVIVHPVQTIPKDTECVPSIRIDRKYQEITDFDFFPGSTNFVIMARTDGIFVVEIDDRSWQNVQPLLLGKKLQFTVDNGEIYVYDGTLIYQISIELE